MTTFFSYLIIWGVLTAAAAAATSGSTEPWVAGARRYDGDDSVMVAVAYAGRLHRRPLALQVQWLGAPNTTLAQSEIWLAANDPLFLHELPDPVDQASPLADPLITLHARGRDMRWRTGTVLPPDLTLAANAKSRGVLSLAWPNGTIWARVSVVEFSGTRLWFWPRSLSLSPTPTPFWHAAQSTWTGGLSRLPSPPGGVLTVRTAGDRVVMMRAGLTVVWDPDATLTTLPLDMYIAATQHAGASGWTIDLKVPGGGLEYALTFVTEDQVTTATSPLLAADPDVNSTTVRIGRRLMAGMAVGWRAQPDWAGGIPAYDVLWVRPLPDAVRYVAVAMAFVFAFLLGYLAAHLLTRLRLLPSLWNDYLVHVPGPSTGLSFLGAHGDATSSSSSPPPSPTPPTWRPYRQAWIALVLAPIVHFLAIFFAARGPLLDATLAEPIHAFAIALAAVSLAHIILLAGETLYAVRKSEPPGQSPVSWTPILFAASHSAVVTRSLVAAMLIPAATSMFALVMVAGTFLIAVLFPSLYTAVLTLTMSIARPRTAFKRTGRRVAWYLQLVVAIGAAAVNGVAGALWLWQPMMDVANALYPDLVISGATAWVVVAAAAAAVALVCYEAGATAVHWLESDREEEEEMKKKS